MAQTISEGEVFNYTTTGVVANTDLLVFNKRAGVALNAATGAGQVIGLALEGVFNVACATTGTMANGDAAYYRTTGTNKKAAVLTASTGQVLFTRGAHTSPTGTVAMARTIGTYWESKTSGATRTTIKVKLIGGPMYYA